MLKLSSTSFAAPRRRHPMYNENTTPYTVSRPLHTVATATTTRRWSPYDELPYSLAPPFEDSGNFQPTTIYAPYSPSWNNPPRDRYYPLNYPTAVTPPPTSTPRPPLRTTTPAAATSSPSYSTQTLFTEVCVPKRHFQCSSGQCIPRWQKCDRVPDCYDASDETGCRCKRIFRYS